MLTEKLGKPARLVVMLHSHAQCVEEHEENDKPIEPLLLHRASDEKSKRTLTRGKLSECKTYVATWLVFRTAKIACSLRDPLNATSKPWLGLNLLNESKYTLGLRNGTQPHSCNHRFVHLRYTEQTNIDLWVTEAFARIGQEGLCNKSPMNMPTKD